MGMIMPKDGSADVCEAWEPCGSCFGGGPGGGGGSFPELAAGLEAEVGITTWVKLVAEGASCLGMGCR